MTIRVRTFADQDAGRVSVSELASRASADILYLLDSATGPEGSDSFDPSPDPETSRLYKEFRDWFGPQVSQTIMGLVVGPLLSKLSVDQEGRVYIEDSVYRQYLSSDDRLAGRVRWLCEEIPSLIETYGQLIEDSAEPGDALKVVDAASALDMSSPDDRKVARILLPELEKWFLYSNPGALIFRGHEESLQELIDAMPSSERLIKKIESEREEAIRASKSDSIKEKDVPYIQDEISRTELSIRKLEDKLIELEKRRESLIESLP